MQDFDAFLAAAWEEHGERPQAVAERLATSVDLLDKPNRIPPYARLAAHVFGEHLGRWQDGVRLIDALRHAPGYDGSAEVDDALARAGAMLRYADGDASAIDTLSSEEAAAALAGAAAALAGRHELSRSIHVFREALGRVDGQVLAARSPAARALAVAGNNLAATLEEKKDRTAHETGAMLEAARAGLTYWKVAGTWLEEERAEYRLGRSLLLAGQPHAAVEAARRCLAICASNDADVLERFFALALVAVAARAAGDQREFEAMRTQALAAHARVPAEQRASITSELAELD